MERRERFVIVGDVIVWFCLRTRVSWFGLIVQNELNVPEDAISSSSSPERLEEPLSEPVWVRGACVRFLLSDPFLLGENPHVLECELM